MMGDEEKQGVDHDALVLENIMRTEPGRSYMWRKLQEWGVFESIWSSDPNTHSYNAGRREAGVELNREIRSAAPGYYVKMIEENGDD